MANLNDLLARAAQDPEFAQSLVADPKRFQQEYNLSDREVEAVLAVGGARAAAAPAAYAKQQAVTKQE